MSDDQTPPAAPGPDARSGPWALVILVAALAVSLIGAWVLLAQRHGAAEDAPAFEAERRNSSPASASDSAAPPPIPTDVEGLLRRVRQAEAEAVLVNVWATWCLPCREEFPDLVELQRRYRDRGFRLFLVSADFDVPSEELVDFLTRQEVDFPSYWKTGTDLEFIDALNPDWSGALPASFLYDSQGKLVKFWEGKVEFEDVEQPLLPLLKGKETS